MEVSGRRVEVEGQTTETVMPCDAVPAQGGRSRNETPGAPVSKTGLAGGTPGRVEGMAKRARCVLSLHLIVFVLGKAQMRR